MLKRSDAHYDIDPGIHAHAGIRAHADDSADAGTSRARKQGGRTQNGTRTTRRRRKERTRTRRRRTQRRNRRTQTPARRTLTAAMFSKRLNGATMNRLSLMAALAVLLSAVALASAACLGKAVAQGATERTLPVLAARGPSVADATRAVVRAVDDEYPGWRAQARCRATAPSRFGCSYSTGSHEYVEPSGTVVTATGPSGRVTVSYKRGRYYVGELRPTVQTPLPQQCMPGYPSTC